jgi:Putative DNA-binding domain
VTRSRMLLQLQRTFAARLLEWKEQGPSPDGLRVEALGFGIHANNTRVSLRIAVEKIYPVTRRLVGVDFFTAMAEQFVACHPPNHGWLSAYGADFADFVAQYRPAADLGYLADIARIEWARVRAANAPDAPGLDLIALARMDPEALEGLPLSLHVAASLVCSTFPAFDIWRAHQHNGGDDEQLPQIDLAIGPQTTLVSRPAALEVGVALLGPGDAAFLSMLAEHSTFGAAYQAAVLQEADYDLASRLGDLVRMRALATFTA